MSAHARLPTDVEIKFSSRSATRALNGFSDPAQFDIDYDRLYKRGYKRNLEDRTKLTERIGVNFDARVHSNAVACRLYTENAANEAVIAQKEQNYAGLSAEQDQRDAAARDIEDRKIAEQARRARATLASLNGSSIRLGGASADRRDARQDKAQEPESEYENESEPDSEPEIVVSKKNKKESVASPEKEKGREIVEEKKEISIKAPVAKPSGFLSGLFSRLSATEVSPEVKMQKMARLAYHVKNCKPDYVLNDEEQRAYACLQAFPHWLHANLSREEGDQLVEVLLKKAD